ncbi:MAG: inosine-uridine nucleoside N-ribohydrolase [Verrucomicrobiales bacterium]|jgi:inosine-uridine nucleoside N-ribohydrolase
MNMKRRLPFLLSLLVATQLAAKDPLPLIFDTDMGNDIDDAMALAMIHQFERRGLCKLLAVTSTKDHPLSAAHIDAINTFYRRPDVPIGAVRDGVAPELGKFLGITKKYPHDLKTGADAPEAVSLLRKTLAAQEDHSVTIVQVGFFTNCARLIESKPDQHSPLDGVALIQKKVKQLVIMAGAFQTIGDETRYLEYNAKLDVPATKLLAERWPGQVVWSGFEIGNAAHYPWKSIEEDFGYTDRHIVREGYLAFGDQNRPTWDLSAVLYAVHPERGYFNLSSPGEVKVADDGATDFQPNGNKRHRYLKMDTVQTARVREAYVQLVSEPPANK